MSKKKSFKILLTIIAIMIASTLYITNSWANSSLNTKYKYYLKAQNKELKIDIKEGDTINHIIKCNNDVVYYLCSNDSLWKYAIMKNNVSDVVFEMDNNNELYFDDVYNDNILVGYGKWNEENQCEFELRKISNETNEVIYKTINTDYPTISRVDNKLVINNSGFDTDNKKYSKLVLLDLDNKDEEEIISTNYSVSDDNKSLGEFISCASGWKDGFVYQKVKIDNEEIDNETEKKTEIYYYSFEDKASIKLEDYPYIAEKIWGDKDEIIISQIPQTEETNCVTLLKKEKNGYVKSTIDKSDCGIYFACKINGNICIPIDERCSVFNENDKFNITENKIIEDDTKQYLEDSSKFIYYTVKNDTVTLYENDIVKEQE